MAPECSRGSVTREIIRRALRESATDVFYRVSGGAGWSAAQRVVSGVASITDSALAYSGSEALYGFVEDMDGNDDTVSDRELFLVPYVDGTWLTAQRATTDNVEDADPRIVFEADGDPIIIWRSSGDFVMATDAAASDRHTVVSSSDRNAVNVGDAQLARGAGGRLGLVWQSRSEALVDLWLATYDPVLDAWSKPMPLTSDDSMEIHLASTFDADSNLIAVYDKLHTVRTLESITVGGTTFDVDMPSAGQTDLYALRHSIRGDLATFAPDVKLAPTNPAPLQPATISALVKNLGDSPASNVRVDFYDGDPGGGGALIGTVTHTPGVLVGGDEVTVSTPWTPGNSPLSHSVWVIVDPALANEDRDRANNTAIVAGAMKPDLRIDSILVQSAGNDRIITIRLANTSGLPVLNPSVTLRGNSESGPLLTTLTVAGTITAGSSADLAWTWTNIPSCVIGEASIFVIADETDTVTEFDEGNNVSSTTVPCNTPSGAGRLPSEPEAGDPLTLHKAAGGDVLLAWGDSCVASDSDSEIYEGALGSFSSREPRYCSTSGATTKLVTPLPGDRYFLVVPRNSTWEGSYGTNGQGIERVPVAASCVPQLIANCP